MQENKSPATPATEEDKLLKPSEVGKLFRVNPKTVGRWALRGRIGSLKTPGGHRRFHADEVEALLKASFTAARATAAVEQMRQMMAERQGS